MMIDTTVGWDSYDIGCDAPAGLRFEKIFGEFEGGREPVGYGGDDGMYVVIVGPRRW